MPVINLSWFVTENVIGQKMYSVCKYIIIKQENVSLKTNKW